VIPAGIFEHFDERGNWIVGYGGSREAQEQKECGTHGTSLQAVFDPIRDRRIVTLPSETVSENPFSLFV
jgi:hypothetical protein